MAEIDLIPQSYRRRRWLRRHLARAGLVAAGLAAILVGTRIALAHAVRLEVRALEQLRSAQADRSQRAARLETLRQERERLAGLAAVMAELRGGLPVDRILLAVDRALEPGVWFDQWSFARAGEFVPAAQGAAQVGYFVVLPREPDAPEPERRWRLRTHMEIRGQARDHAALAAFVRRLVAQPEIDEARVIGTDTTSEAGPVDFELGVVVGGRG